MMTDYWPKNLFADIPNRIPTELITILLNAGHARIERIVSQGHTSPPDFWYDQDENEFVLLVTGAARLQFEDRVIEMKGGDCINIPAHERHRVEWTTQDEQTVW